MSSQEDDTQSLGSESDFVYHLSDEDVDADKRGLYEEEEDEAGEGTSSGVKRLKSTVKIRHVKISPGEEIEKGKEKSSSGGKGDSRERSRSPLHVAKRVTWADKSEKERPEDRRRCSGEPSGGDAGIAGESAAEGDAVRGRAG